MDYHNIRTIVRRRHSLPFFHAKLLYQPLEAFSPHENMNIIKCQFHKIQDPQSEGIKPDSGILDFLCPSV